MKANQFTERLKNLKASDRFDVLYGPQKNDIEENLGCKILTLPLEQLSNLSEEITYFMVTDSSQGNSYLAVLQPIR